MAKRNIIKIGDPLLRLKSKPVIDFDERLSTLLDDMRDTMVTEKGVGIAAVQVGVLRRVCIVSEDGLTFYEFINPVVIKSKGKQISYEGCLSIPNQNGDVQRPKSMTIRAYGRDGVPFELEVSGYLAVICSHEFDHMDGVLFTDKLILEKKEG